MNTDVSWSGSILRLLGNAGYALAKNAPPKPGGHVWQNWAYSMIISAGSSQVQGPGSLHLYGYPSASGIPHELDAAGISDVAVVLEAKDQAQPLTKYQVDSFDGRTFDYFEGCVLNGFRLPIYRVIWSTGTTEGPVRRYAALKGIIIVGPDRVPLPTLIAAAERWDAIDWLPEEFLPDFVLLGERACRPLETCGSGCHLRYEYPLGRWTGSDLDDLEYLHMLASAQWLDWIDHTDPLFFGRFTADCLRRVSGWQELRYPVNDKVSVHESGSN